jgi:hypothetical protein
MMVGPPMSRSEFEEKNRRLLMGDGFLPEVDISAWQRGRDWLAQRATESEKAAPRRRSPRLQISLTAHIAGVGRAVTDDVGFWGMRLLADKMPRLVQGDEASVRLNLAGRSIYVLGRVVWVDRGRVGLSLDAAHPADERALQAAVCNGLLDRWDG